MSIQKVRQLSPEITKDEIASATAKVFGIGLRNMFVPFPDELSESAINMCIYLFTLKTRLTSRHIASYFVGLTPGDVIRTKIRMRRLLNQDTYHLKRMSKILAITG